MQNVVQPSRGRRWKIHLRDQADASVLAEVFKLKEYRRADSIIEKAAGPIVDVGAHSGLFTLYARSLNPTVPIIAIEPEKNNLELLRKHLRENKVGGVEIEAAALSSKTGRGLLVLSDGSHNHYLGDFAGSLSGAKAKKKAAAAQKIQPVATLNFADLLRRYKIRSVSLLKMDIEGGEYRVFGSLAAADFARLQSIILEYHNYGQGTGQELADQLRANGFGVQLFPSKFDKRMGFIWARNKR